MTCLFCQQENCNRDECEEIRTQLAAEEDAHYRNDLKKAVCAAFKQRCKTNSEWYLGRLSRWFYTAKALLCVAFGLRRNCQRVPGYPDTVEVAQYHYAKLYAGWEEDCLVVGHGVFRQWWFDLEHDGDWWL